ncbi:DUF6528 family protein [Niabella sp. CC-SYL272]|uniref:DUF6528 family protein n=1 Tax=Niabella agricola TaxID=2891571 RepID=UPI001F36724B|nr:DUF6528 family protein [Niabella agricola]MCF3110643.1 DUF6528 family protein [Niabella agricola]
MKILGLFFLPQWPLGIIALLAACSQRTAPNASSDERGASNDWPVAIVNQGAGQVMVFDSKVSDWNNSAARVWSWFPDASNGFPGDVGWGAPSDVKLRSSTFFGGQVVAIADSRGFCGLVPYPAGNKKLWAIDVGRPGPAANNPHAIELLPDGNVAIAASNGNSVRVYTSSQGPASVKYVNFTLSSAHGVLWDPAEKILWALGSDVLTGLEIGGTAAAPVINEKAGCRFSLPTTGGHDLFAFYGDKNRLWLTTSKGVYTFNKTTKTFTPVGSYNSEVKSIGNQPSGQVVLTMASTCTDGWNTNTVRYDYPAYTRTIKGACFYKARVWWSAYQ